jgi:hypothetical protein
MTVHVFLFVYLSCVFIYFIYFYMFLNPAFWLLYSNKESDDIIKSIQQQYPLNKLVCTTTAHSYGQRMKIFKKLFSLNSSVMDDKMTPIKPQISKLINFF